LPTLRERAAALPSPGLRRRRGTLAIGARRARTAAHPLPPAPTHLGEFRLLARVEFRLDPGVHLAQDAQRLLTRALEFVTAAGDDALDLRRLLPPKAAGGPADA
jgi:hypothetical protein